MKDLWFPSLFSTWTARPVQATHAGWGAGAGDILGVILWLWSPCSALTASSSEQSQGHRGHCSHTQPAFSPCLFLGLGFFPSCLCLGFGLFSPCLCLGFGFFHCLFLGFVFFFPLCAWVLVFDHRFCRAASALPLLFPLWCHQASPSIPWKKRD